MKSNIIRLFNLCLMVCGLAAGMSGCSKDSDETIIVDDPAFSVRGQWYAEVPLEGETYDMLTAYELAPYDHVVVVLSMFENTFNSTLLYLYGEELINCDYGMYLAGEDNYTIDMDGNITVQNTPEYTGEFKSAKYEKDEIKVTMNVREGELSLTFRRPTGDQLQEMAKWMALIYSGLGYMDDDEWQQTDVTDDPATEPAQVRRK